MGEIRKWQLIGHGFGVFGLVLFPFRHRSPAFLLTTGVLLLKECRAVLSVYRRRVEELSQNAEESVRAYTGDPDAGDDAPSRARDSARASSPGKERS